ncbi:MAG: hypothetical protein Q9170_008079 [Blastenia crenularia]
MASSAGIGPANTGVVPPPPGVKFNLQSPDYHSGGIIPLVYVFITLAAIFMGLRVYTKARISKVFGLDDFGLTKVAILLFYLRLNPERDFRTSVYVSLALTISYVIALSLAILFEFNP